MKVVVRVSVKIRVESYFRFVVEITIAARGRYRIQVKVYWRQNKEVRSKEIVR